MASVASPTIPCGFLYFSRTLKDSLHLVIEYKLNQQLVNKEDSMNRILCYQCRKVIERPPYRIYVDLESGLELRWHDSQDCWGRTIFPIDYEYYTLIFRLKMKEVSR
jgi:hypothetical protein